MGRWNVKMQISFEHDMVNTMDNKKSLERRDLWNEQEIIKGKGSYWNRCNLLFMQKTTFFYV